MPHTAVKAQKVSKAKVPVSAEVPAQFLTAFCPYIYLIPFPPSSSVCACYGGFLKANLRMPSGWDWQVTAWADMLYQGQGCWGSSSVWHDPRTKVQTADLMPVGIFSKLFKGNAVICKNRHVNGPWTGRRVHWACGCTQTDVRELYSFFTLVEQQILPVSARKYNPFLNPNLFMISSDLL